MHPYRLRPFVVKAEQFDGSEASAKSLMTHFYPGVRPVYDGDKFAGQMTVQTPSGLISIGPLAWVVDGRFTGLVAFEPDVFAANFEPIVG
jgi:hypothetical protein